MNSHVHRFYRKFADEQAPIRLFHEVIGPHEVPQLSWEEIVGKAPLMPKGWYELSHLKPSDRIEFARDFWLSTLPFLPSGHAFFQKFFSKLDDVGIYLTQLRYDSAFESELVYSLKDGSCFYHGSPPCTEEEISQLKLDFQNLLPEDYLSFLKIHDGFSKHSDVGIIKTRYLKDVGKQLQEEMEQEASDFFSGGNRIDPIDLIPFYESFGSPSYQCFFAGWTPLNEAGNIYYSSSDQVISDIRDPAAWQENLAFPTFLNWLIFYLESVE